MRPSWVEYTPARRSTWITWLVLCASVFVLQLQTLEIDPLIQQDEVQIVDLGRTILDQSTDWSITWFVQGGQPTLSLHYLGVALQELAFQAFAPSNLGPRLVAVLAAIAAATSALGWLMARGTPGVASLALALAFLVDPIFSDIYRGGRIDGWAIAAVLGSCWLLRVASVRAVQGLAFKSRVGFAGALAATSFFLWMSAAILFPLVLLEFYRLLRATQRPAGKERRSHWAVASLWLLGGGFLAGAILLVPVLLNFEAFLVSTINFFEAQKSVAGIQHPLVGMLATYSPLFLLAVMAAFALRREAGLVIALGAALLMVYQTAVYLPRILYLFPYGLAAIACAYSPPPGRRPFRYTVLLRQLLLVGLVGYNALLVLAVRPVLAEARKPGNLPQQFAPALAEAVGPGPRRVLLEEWQAYYAGRELGWRMYLFSNPVPGPEYTRFLSGMDYVIIRSPTGWYGAYRHLDAAGFELVSSIPFAAPGAAKARWLGFELDVPPFAYPKLDIYRKSDGAVFATSRSSPRGNPRQPASR